MNKNYYNQVPRLSISKVHTFPRTTQELISKAQYNLTDFHLSKSHIYGQRV